jgi:phosphoenolpyruvate synthase/pyruvate phosphate dikinase
MKKYVIGEADVNWLKDFTDVEYSHTFKQQYAGDVNDEGKKVLKSGTLYPTNSTDAIGIVLRDVDVTDGDTAGSLLVRGAVIESRLPQELTDEVKKALNEKGIYFYTDNTAE